jgi:hypothetical protein
MASEKKVEISGPLEDVRPALTLVVSTSGEQKYA